jgi:hypothetical protein
LPKATRKQTKAEWEEKENNRERNESIFLPRFWSIQWVADDSREKSFSRPPGRSTGVSGLVLKGAGQARRLESLLRARLWDKVIDGERSKSPKFL